MSEIRPKFLLLSMYAATFLAACNAFSSIEEFPEASPSDADVGVADQGTTDTGFDAETTQDTGAPDLPIGECSEDVIVPDSHTNILGTSLASPFEGGSIVARISVAERRQGDAADVLVGWSADSRLSLGSVPIFDEAGVMASGNAATVNAMGTGLRPAQGISGVALWNTSAGEENFNIVGNGCVSDSYAWVGTDLLNLTNIDYASDCEVVSPVAPSFAGGWAPYFSDTEFEPTQSIWIETGGASPGIVAIQPGYQEESVAGEGGILRSDFAQIPTEIDAELFPTSGRFVFFRGEDESIYAWDAIQAATDRKLATTAAPPIKVIDRSEIGGRGEFSIVHINADLYVVAHVSADADEVLLSTLTFPNGTPVWNNGFPFVASRAEGAHQIDLAAMAGGIGLFFNEESGPNGEADAWTFALFEFDYQNAEFNEIGRYTYAFQAEIDPIAVDTVLVRRGFCDIVAVAAVMFESSAETRVNVEFPVFRNAARTAF